MAENFKITKKLREGNSATIEVEIPGELLAAEQEKEIERAARKVNISGFRKGKAPRDVVLRHLDLAVLREQAVENLAQKVYPDVIKEASLEPVETPSVEIQKVSDSGPIGLKFKMAVYPEVKLGKYKGLKASRMVVEVQSEEVDRVLKDLQENFAQFQSLTERGAARGDVVVFDLETSVDGTKIGALTGKAVRLEVGQSRLPAPFDEGLVDIHPGEERAISFTCPPDFWISELSGKPAVARVHLKELFLKKVPSLDDEFSKTYLQKNTLEEARGDITRRISESKEKAADARCREQLLEALVKETQVDIPQAMIDRETDMMLREMDEDLRRDHIDLEVYLKRTRKSLDELRQELRETALTRVKSKVALRTVARTEKIAVNAEEIDAEFRRLAENESKDPTQFQKELGEAGRNYVEDYLLRRKALDFLVSKGKIETVREAVPVPN